MLRRAEEKYEALRDGHELDYEKHKKSLARRLAEFSSCMGWIDGRSLSLLGKVTSTTNGEDHIFPPHSTDERIVDICKKGSGWQGKTAKLNHAGTSIETTMGLMKLDPHLIRDFISRNPDHAFSKLSKADPATHRSYRLDV